MTGEQAGDAILDEKDIDLSTRKKELYQNMKYKASNWNCNLHSYVDSN